jgi:hypothetical protein
MPALIEGTVLVRSPALVIGGRVVSTGRIPSHTEISAWIQAPMEVYP